MNRFFESERILTTVGSATQLYTPLSPTGSASYMITGTAVGQNYQLPDATTLPFAAGVKSLVIRFTNSSSEFVGICPSGSTTFLARIPPRGVATFVLTAAGTAAGTWAGWMDNCESCGGNKVVYGGFEITTGYNSGGYQAASGTGSFSRSTTPSDTAVVNAMGFYNTWWHGYLGTDNGGACYTFVKVGGAAGAGGGFLLSDGPFAHTTRFSIDTLPTAAEDFTFHVGFYSIPDGVGSRLGLRLDRTIGGGANYYLSSRVGGVSDNQDSGVLAVAKTPVTSHMEKSRSGTRADLFINRVWRCTTANSPVADQTQSIYIISYGVACAGGTTRKFAANMHRLIIAPANPFMG